MDNIKGLFTLLLFSTNTVIIVSTLLPIAFIRLLLLPLNLGQKTLGLLLISLAELWIKINAFFLQYFVGLKIQSNIDQLSLSPERWYLVTSNHQTWADIPLLQTLLLKKIPFLKFFLKQELIWVPFLGLAWWALDFPFMKRYSKKFLAKNPDKKDADLLATQKACEKFKLFPSAIFNFLEGTRFSENKRLLRQSPFRHLLPPKAGGIGSVNEILGDKIHELLDVTLIYPHRSFNFWDFLCGRIKEVQVVLRLIVIPVPFRGRSYHRDKVFQGEFQQWINTLWQEKDQLLESSPFKAEG